MNQITNDRPETFQELRQMIAQAKKIYVLAWINDGILENPVANYESLEVTKTYALSLYKGSIGEYIAFDNAAHWYGDTKSLYLN